MTRGPKKGFVVPPPAGPSGRSSQFLPKGAGTKGSIDQGEYRSTGRDSEGWFGGWPGQGAPLRPPGGDREVEAESGGERPVPWSRGRGSRLETACEVLAGGVRITRPGRGSRLHE
jgi:hypothetical protein